MIELGVAISEAQEINDVMAHDLFDIGWTKPVEIINEGSWNFQSFSVRVVATEHQTFDTDGFSQQVNVIFIKWSDPHMLTEILNRFLAKHKRLLGVGLLELLDEIWHPIGSGLD